MARITRVNRAQIRKDSDGNVKPNLVCDLDRTEIKPGDPYKWIGIKTGPRSSKKLVRCDACPDWQVWDYSNSVSARTAKITYDFERALESADTKSEVEEALNTAAEEARGIAEEKREGASNTEEGFGHPTSASEELENVAGELDGWANEIEALDVEDEPQPEDEECERCEGDCYTDPEEDDDRTEGDTNDEDKIECPECGGNGHPDEVDEESVEEWRGNIELPDCPI